MSIGLTVESREDGNAWVLTLAGELSLAEAQVLEQKLGEVLASADSTIIVDLTDVAFIDSTGLSVLVRAHQQASEAGVQLGVVNPRAQAKRLLSLTGLAERLTFVNSQAPRLQDRVD